MRKASILLVVILLISLSFPPSAEGSGPILVITPLKEELKALPGQTIEIPFQIRNLGNDTIGNVTVYVTGPAEGFVYQTKLIRVPIPPNGTLNESLSVRVLIVPPGVYNLTIVARAGSTYTEAQVKVRIGVLSDYSLGIDVKKKYLYGHDVEVKVRVVSKSNGVLLGTLGYSIVKDGIKIVENESSTYLKPGETWEKAITLRRPSPGNYTVTLWANLGGKFRKVTKKFTVYQRRLSYRAYFRSGAIVVLVYNSSGGVPGISVRINGTELTTNEDGKVSYAVDKPGTYEVVLDLDGKIVTTFVEVKRLFMSYEQNNSTLVVHVVDSTGSPVSNVTLVASGPLGKEYSVTNASGIALINLTKTGYGTLLLSAESEDYIGTQLVIQASRPELPKASTTSTTETPSTTQLTNVTSFPTVGEEKSGAGVTALLLILGGLILAGTSYLAFAVPLIHEETLDGYYFVKIRAPRLRPLRGYRFERAVSAREVRATKGTARLEGGRIIWELDLEPGEEAQLQALLG